MANELLLLIGRLALASSAAIAVVLALRPLLRNRLGAVHAYAAWLAVPATMAAVLLPPLAIAPPQLAAVLIDLGGASAQPVKDAAPSSGALAQWLLLAWAAGTGLMAGHFFSSHWHYVRSLGRLAPAGDAWVAEHDGAGPLLLGLWRQRVVLPRDFATRFSADEQVLILAHERLHAARGDPAANALLAVLQCCFWFNPLVHIAAPRFRLDQELACDSTVMAAHPGSARVYASAMMKSQLDDATLSASCHWQSHHPLKERIMNLQHFPHAPSRRLAGRVAIGLLVVAGASAALVARADTAAAHTAKGGRYDVGMTLTALGTTSHPRLLVREGEIFKVSKGSDAEQWDGEFLLTAHSVGKVMMKSKVTLNGQPMGEQSMLMDAGTQASMNVSSDDGKLQFALVMTAKPVPDATSPK